MTNNQETNTADVEKAFEAYWKEGIFEGALEEAGTLGLKEGAKMLFTAGARSRDAYIQLLKDTREMADKEIEQLREELDTEGRIQGELYCEKVASIATAQDQLREAVEVIRFYADKENYSLTTHQRPRMAIEKRILSKSDCSFVAENVHEVGGKRARAFLTKHQLNSEEV